MTGKWSGDATESWTDWYPVPPEMSRYMILNVVHVEHIRLIGGTPLSIILASSIQRDVVGADPSSIQAWRVSFSEARAFRCIEIGDWEGPAPYSDERLRILKAATWEVLNC